MTIHHELAKAQAKVRQLKKQRDADKPKRVIAKRVEPSGPGQRQPRERDNAYLAWLHQGIPCIACEIELRLPSMRADCGPIEAAHQKLAIASRGWREGGGGKRVSDRRTIALCRWHHQLAPNACDKGQRKFWDRLNVGDDIAAICDELYNASKSGGNGAAIIQRWAADARRRA